MRSEWASWALQNVLVQKLLLQIVTENVIESLRFFTLLIKMVANFSAYLFKEKSKKKPQDMSKTD